MNERKSYEPYKKVPERFVAPPERKGRGAEPRTETIPDTGEALLPFQDREIGRLIIGPDGRSRLSLERASLEPNPDQPGWLLRTTGVQPTLREGETQILFLGDPEEDAVRPATTRGVEFLL